MRIGLQAWGSEGDISPFLTLSTGLAHAGHTVTLVVTDNVGRDYSRHSSAGRFKLLTVPLPRTSTETADRVWQEIISIGNPLRQAELVLKHGYDPVADAMLEAATNLVSANDLVIGHFFAYPLQIAAEVARKPAATLAIVHNCMPTTQWQAPGLPDFGAWSHRWGWKLSQSIVNSIFLPRYNSQRHRMGLRPLRDTMTQAWASPLLNLLAVSPSICKRPADWSRNHVITGFINDTNPPANCDLPGPLDAFLSNGVPPVFIGFGSMMQPRATRFATETIALWRDTIRDLGIRAVIQLPQPLLPLCETTENIHTVSWSDYRLLFPRCAAIIHHGGAGTTQSALRAGRPSLIVAHVSDQFFWGQELERLKVAGPTQRRKRLTSRKLRKSIAATMANPSLAHNATLLGQAMSNENGLDTAIRAIETAYASTV